MSLSKALAYEYIVRTANDCGRCGTAGANADIFRHLERVWAKGFDDKYIGTAEKRAFALGEVSAFLRDSIERLIKSKSYNDDNNNELQQIYDSLLNPSLTDIDTAIDSTARILNLQ